MQDALGQRGEALFTILMTAFEPGEQPLFRPQFLGDKWPYIDFFVELLGHDDIKPFFFVQVKTTRQGYTKRQHRLKIGVAEDKILGLGTSNQIIMPELVQDDRRYRRTICQD
jgi:hypothetical protein